MGQAVIQLARRLGATVVATASEANHDRPRQLGAIPVAYGPGLVDRVRAAAPQGVDVALDAAGTEEAIEVSRHSSPITLASPRSCRVPALPSSASARGAAEPVR